MLNKTPCVVTIGNFDGLHIGHRTLLLAADEMARQLAAREGVLVKRYVLTFSPHPQQVFRGEGFQLIYPETVKQTLVEETGLMDSVETISFCDVMDMEPADFFGEVVLKKLGACGVVVGENFRFGKAGKGKAEDLARLCEEAGILCRVVPEVIQGCEAVSSTRIKKKIAEGDMEEANKLLGRPYFIEGIVRSGKQLGRTMEIPTANVSLYEGCLMPKNGVYASKAIVGEKRYFSITNVGNNPTFSERDVRSETFLFDCGLNLYGSKIRIELCKFIRPEMTFDSALELKERIGQDIKEVKDFFAAL